MAKTDDTITPARLRADGWTQDGSDKNVWWIDIDFRRTLFFSIDNNDVHYSNIEWVYIRSVAGMDDLKRLVAALKGSE